MKKVIKKNMKVIVTVIITATITGSIVYALNGSDVIYDNTNSNLSATTVQGAIDELYEKSQNAGGVPIDPDTFKTNTTKTVLASSKGVCINRNGKLNCFKINNYAEEQNHIQQVFSDISCGVNSDGVRCRASDFPCRVASNGSVYCTVHSDHSYCNVHSDGSVDCN